MKYSVIIPLYNRPDEIRELLESLCQQQYRDFEVLVVEDGSENDAADIVHSFEHQLNVRYFTKPNTGQGFTRNFAFEHAKGEWFVIFDSDALIPSNYFDEVNLFLEKHPAVRVFGGPDAAHHSFTPVQKAISYSMTSLFTTGGIRGNEEHVGAFHPRSFNMGIHRSVWKNLGGFKITRMGEDLEYSIRIINAGYTSALIPKAFIYHKRRTSIVQFYKQLFFFGRARINIKRFYPNEVKVVHLLPAVFVLSCFALGATFFIDFDLFKIGIGIFGVYYALIFLDSLVKNKSLPVALISIVTSFVQLYAYGMGFFSEGRKFIVEQKQSVT